MNRNTFELNKQKQGFLTQQTRAACWKCDHAISQADNNAYQCSKGGFFVTAYAVCNIFKFEKVRTTP